jgi:hypothetical protein
MSRELVCKCRPNCAFCRMDRSETASSETVCSCSERAFSQELPVMPGCGNADATRACSLCGMQYLAFVLCSIVILMHARLMRQLAERI